MAKMLTEGAGLTEAWESVCIAPGLTGEVVGGVADAGAGVCDAPTAADCAAVPVGTEESEAVEGLCGTRC